MQERTATGVLIMKYLSIAQNAERWGISTRRIQILCGEWCIPVLSALARSGGFQRMQRSQRMRESRTGSISRNLPKTKNEPQIISATLTRNKLIRKGPWVRIPPSPPEIMPVVGFSGCWLFFFSSMQSPSH